MDINKLKCLNCNKKLKGMQEKWCSQKCMNSGNYIKHKEVIKKRNLDYYYTNREKVLKYQIDRWSKKFKEDKKFREIRYVRDKTRKRHCMNLKGKKCNQCNSEKDLHRHHPEKYNPNKFTILCRKCHNKLHQKLKNNLK